MDSSLDNHQECDNGKDLISELPDGCIFKAAAKRLFCSCSVLEELRLQGYVKVKDTIANFTIVEPALKKLFILFRTSYEHLLVIHATAKLVVKSLSSVVIKCAHDYKVLCPGKLRILNGARFKGSMIGIHVKGVAKFLLSSRNSICIPSFNGRKDEL
ncbi:hypothetical protein Patl1_04972 [Pistacia atlantica]|uniref:Uncharacterized protein n=1 Tax=Pistacia atlantica TaxID=434234 RepID=A0ACC1BX69_9ROSI|nr:hypothetical protein Patl1_04972 [Pistacia atlantica]